MLKTQILELKQKGLTQKAIAKHLNCSTGTVSYHCNPEVKCKILLKKRNRKKPAEVSSLIDKELHITPKKVCWKHAELVCIAKLVEYGYDVFIPVNTGGEIDVIATKNNEVFKIQIKSISPTNNQSISLNLERSSINYGTSLKKPYQNVDFFLIFDGMYIYKVLPDNFQTGISLRYLVPKNNQIENIRMASDYLY